MAELDPVLDRWLVEQSAGEPSAQQTVASTAGQDASASETHLPAAGGDSGGTPDVQVDMNVLFSAAAALRDMADEVGQDTRTAVDASGTGATPRSFQLPGAVAHVHDRWLEKLTHLTDTMHQRATDLQDTASHWRKQDSWMANYQYGG